MTPTDRERKLLPRLIIVNILLILTVAFLIKAFVDVANDLEHPPRSGGVFYMSQQP